MESEFNDKTFCPPSSQNIEQTCAAIEYLKDNFTDAVVVLTGGAINLPQDYYTDRPYRYKTACDARIRAIAGAITYYDLVERGHSPVLILTGGKVERADPNSPSLSSVMKYELSTHFHIPPEHIVEEPYSINTPENAKNCSKILNTLGFPKQNPVNVITNDFHLSRSIKLFNRYFPFNLTPKSAEQILIQYQNNHSNIDKRRYKEFAQKHINSDEYKMLVKKDEILKKLTDSELGEDLLTLYAYLFTWSNTDNK